MVYVKAFDKFKYERQGGLMELSVATVVGASYFCWHTWSTLWWEAAHTKELWVYRCDRVVCSQVWHDSFAVWSPQTGYQWWVQEGHHVPAWSRWQDPCCPEQSWPSWHPTGKLSLIFWFSIQMLCYMVGFSTLILWCMCLCS